MSAIDFLARARELDQAATEGPWRRDWYAGVVDPKSRVMTARSGYDTCLADYLCEQDATFIVHARTALPALVAFAEDVLALHHHEWSCGNSRHTNPEVGCPECAEVCVLDGEPMPCPTVRAAEKHLGSQP